MSTSVPSASSSVSTQPNSATFAGADPGASYLTPDALMVYVETRMGQIDTQVKATFSQQERTNAEQGIIRDALAQIQQNSGGINTADPAKCQQMEQALEDAYDRLKAMDPRSPELDKLAAVHDQMMASGSGPYDTTNPDGKTVHHHYLSTQSDTPPSTISGDKGQDSILSTDEMKAFVDDLNAINSDMNSDSELQMIQLQSLMSQRQTAIQLATNLVQSLDDQANKIAQNVGH
jgi:hypothetical protein